MKRGRKLFIFLLFLVTILAACVPVPATSTFSPKATVTATPSIQPPTRTPTVSPTHSSSKPTYYRTPTPALNWNSEVIAVSWEPFYGSVQPEWLNNSVVNLFTSLNSSKEQFHTVDISKGENAQMELISDHSRYQVYSPQKNYVIECLDSMKMVRVSDQEMLGETTLPYSQSRFIPCPFFVQWSADENYVTYIDSYKTGYIWYVDDAEPQIVLEDLDNIVSSPNSKMLAIGKYDSDSLSKIVMILSLDGELLQQFSYKIMDLTGLTWLTDEVLVSFTKYVRSYYKISSGELLFDWKDAPTGDLAWHQQPLTSPNGRWIFIDQGSVLHEKVFIENGGFMEKEYTLYDVLLNTRFSLLHYIGNYLAYAGWNNDGSKLFLISRPAESVSDSGPDTPFGLLIYDPISQAYDLIFKDAVRVFWNNNCSLAFVVYAEQDPRGKKWLSGTFWNPISNEKIGYWQIDNEMVYQDPAMDLYPLIFSEPFTIEWSNAGDKIVVVDGFGKISLLKIDGTVEVLTEDASFLKRSTHLRWSPDDKHLAIAKNGQAWIVDVSSP